MLPERLNFLGEFTNFYNNLVLDLKGDRYNEQEFYLIIISKCKSMDRKRKEKLTYVKQIGNLMAKNRV